MRPDGRNAQPSEPRSPHLLATPGKYRCLVTDSVPSRTHKPRICLRSDTRLRRGRLEGRPGRLEGVDVGDVLQGDPDIVQALH